MADCVHNFEWALIRGNSASDQDGITEKLPQHVKDILDGDYKAVLTSSLAGDLLGRAEQPSAAETALIADGELDSYVKPRLAARLAGASAETQFEVLCVGVAALYAFMQGAWTGPLLPFKSEELFPSAVADHWDAIRRKTLEQLAVDSEEAYVLTIEPVLLMVARWILVDAAPQLADLESADWWTARTAFVHQRIIDNPTSTLQAVIAGALDRLAAKLPPVEKDRNLAARYNLEYGLFHHYFRQDAKSVERFTAAQEAGEFSWTLTGALGKRTKFQTFEVSQLVVQAESRRNTKAPMPNAVEKPAATPENFAHNDDTLLEKIEITDKSMAEQGNLNVIDQCILLAFCLNVKNTNPDHGLTTEQMMPYVRRVLDNANNWMVHTMSLLLRSRLESAKSRTVERSVLQLNALVDQFPLEESKPSERMEHIFSIMMPSKWELERELGERFVGLGVTRSALEIFERLQMWEDVVSCHIMLEQADKAEAIVRRLLQESPRSPKLLCILGDVRGEIEHYELAWEYSGRRFARAMRSLGAHYFKKEDMQRSLECYQLALAINPLFENSWFVMGCAALRVENFDVAEQAFARVTVLDPDNSEAWNNLASVHIKLRKLREAFNCLREALRHNYDASNIWENFLFVSVDIGEFSEAIRAMQRVLEIRADKPQFKDRVVDVEVLDIITLAVINGQYDAAGETAWNLAPKMAKLLEAVTAKIATPKVFLICARFAQWQNRLRDALEFYQKAYRAVLHHPNVDTDEAVFKTLVEYTIKLADAFVELGPREEEVRVGGSTGPVCKDWAYQARQAVKSVISRTKATYEGSEAHDQLVEKLQELKAL
ncbi:hypothetical protein HK105_200808 [Polyrhizophydium stewartii]|uniref:TPR-like protein n=1 Tax=Polyrhizophydium stewartii TaxID=2732419 RepID=A0ABR4NKB0_9FUNG|nr:hypothetical protein HK105_000487 [Polyrhizophydium stewartii]